MSTTSNNDLTADRKNAASSDADTYHPASHNSGRTDCYGERKHGHAWNDWIGT